MGLLELWLEGWVFLNSILYNKLQHLFVSGCLHDMLLLLHVICEGHVRPFCQQKAAYTGVSLQLDTLHDLVADACRQLLALQTMQWHCSALNHTYF